MLRLDDLPRLLDRDRGDRRGRGSVVMDDARLLALAERVLRIEAEAVLGLIPRLDDRVHGGGRLLHGARGA